MWPTAKCQHSLTSNAALSWLTRLRIVLCCWSRWIVTSQSGAACSILSFSWIRWESLFLCSLILILNLPHFSSLSSNFTLPPCLALFFLALCFLFFALCHVYRYVLSAPRNCSHLISSRQITHAMQWYESMLSVLLSVTAPHSSATSNSRVSSLPLPYFYMALHSLVLSHCIAWYTLRSNEIKWRCAASHSTLSSLHLHPLLLCSPFFTFRP